jgi:glucose/arabinose dehydrogenase
VRGVTLLALTLFAAGETLHARACDNKPQDPAPEVTPSPPSRSDGPVFTTQDGVRFRVEVVVNNLEIPWSFVFAPDGRLFVTERPGRVQLIDIPRQTSQLALRLDDVFIEGESGLLGLALDPSFASNGLVYLYYTARASANRAVNRVVRYRFSGNALAEGVVLLDNIPANVIHDGRRIRFGPDGLLYITAGDAATEQLAQDVASLAGKILRINPDGTTPRANPFSSPVYSYGHRNPQGIDWNPVTGDLWESEHGATGNDEINVIDAGANYGWPTIEGSRTMPAMREPITFYNPSIAPSGASFYRGQRNLLWRECHLGRQEHRNSDAVFHGRREPHLLHCLHGGIVDAELAVEGTHNPHVADRPVGLNDHLHLDASLDLGAHGLGRIVRTSALGQLREDYAWSRT